MKRPILIGAAAAVILAAWGGYVGWRAHSNLVTLDVRDMDVRKVVSKIEWQTWERIIVHNDVQGKITLNVTRVPIDTVLTIIGDQTESRWTSLYPLYTKGESLVRLKKIARGDLPREGNGWTNFQTRGPGFGGRGGPPGMFGDALRADNNLVNLKVDNRDLAFATLALSRYSQAQLVPEDGTDGTLNLRLTQVSLDKAVAAVAKQVKRDWDHLYAIQPNGGRGGDFGFGRGDRPDRGRGDRDLAGDRGPGRGGDRERRPPDDTNRVEVAEQRRERFQAEREKQFEAMMATMTPEEQKKAQEQRQQMEEMRNMTPEERQQRFQEMASRPEFQRQMQQRTFRGVLNTTPEQRAERNQRRVERQKEWQARQNQQTR